MSAQKPWLLSTRRRRRCVKVGARGGRGDWSVPCLRKVTAGRSREHVLEYVKLADEWERVVAGGRGHLRHKFVLNLGVWQRRHEQSEIMQQCGARRKIQTLFDHARPYEQGQTHLHMQRLASRADDYKIWIRMRADACAGPRCSTQGMCARVAPSMRRLGCCDIPG